MADERAVVEELIAAINAHDRETACNLFAPEGQMVTAGGRTLDVSGIDGLLRHTMDAFPDVAVTVRRWVVDHDVVVTEELMEGTHKGVFAGLAPSGRRVQIPMVHITRVDGGRIVDRVAYHDTAALVRQLAPEPRT
jgi:predicted ester cyclase